jgi:hypothetical protein
MIPSSTKNLKIKHYLHFRIIIEAFYIQILVLISNNPSKLTIIKPNLNYPTPQINLPPNKVPQALKLDHLMKFYQLDLPPNN